MNKNTVLVTGAAGFTGGHLCKKLVENGYLVRALIRSPNQADGLEKMGAEVSYGDLRDFNSLEKAIRGIDIVYHIGALFRPENVTRKDMFETNVLGTKNILEAAVKGGIQRFVHCSTVGVHGDIKNPPASEETSYGPGDYYQESKTEGEKVVLEYMHAHRLPIVVFRPGGIYGPGDLRFLKLYKAIKSRKFIMLGSGKILYQLIYIDDLVEGILLCGQLEQALGNIYILTGAEPVTLNHLVYTVAEVLGVAPPKFRIPVAPVYWASFVCELIFKPLGLNPPIYRRRIDFFRKTRSFNITKAQKELGFKPIVDLKAGLQLTANWYRETGHL